MKKVSAGRSGKPPSVRLQPKRFPPIPSDRLVSMSETQEMFELREGLASFNFTSKESSQCMSQWLTFLKVLRMLCSSGSDLVDSLYVLNCGSKVCQSRLDKSKAMWEHLRVATSSAASVVSNQAFASLQEAHIAPDIDQDQADNNQGVVCSGLLRLLNLQYQFSAACCEWISAMPGCTCVPPHPTTEVEAVSRCFPEMNSTTVSIQVPQRRWSEAAAANRDKAPQDPAFRRWSIPWKLALPSSTDRSRSTTPDAVWHTTLASQEELQDVIALLSARPTNYSNSSHLPGGASARTAESDTSGKSQRVSWWGENEEVPNDNGAAWSSRKSSSSTDTSSCCYSLPKSTTSSEELHGSAKSSTLYSMWSGGEIPFIKLPEHPGVDHPDSG